MIFRWKNGSRFPISILERMRCPNGGYIASPYNAEDGSGDAYNVFWIPRHHVRDLRRTNTSAVSDKMVESFRLVLDIFKKFHPLIVQASIIKPDVRHQTGLLMPARVHPAPRWTPSPMRGAIISSMSTGCLFMYKMGDLIKKGYGFRFKRRGGFFSCSATFAITFSTWASRPITACGRKARRIIPAASARCSAA